MITILVAKTTRMYYFDIGHNDNKLHRYNDTLTKFFTPNFFSHEGINGIQLRIASWSSYSWPNVWPEIWKGLGRIRGPLNGSPSPSPTYM